MGRKFFKIKIYIYTIKGVSLWEIQADEHISRDVMNFPQSHAYTCLVLKKFSGGGL